MVGVGIDWYRSSKKKKKTLPEIQFDTNKCFSSVSHLMKEASVVLKGLLLKSF